MSEKYRKDAFSIQSISVENNILRYDGTRHDMNHGIYLWQEDFVFTCNDAERLACFLRVHVDSLADYIRETLEGHVDVLELYCRKHSLECEVKRMKVRDLLDKQVQR